MSIGEFFFVYGLCAVAVCLYALAADGFFDAD